VASVADRLLLDYLKTSSHRSLYQHFCSAARAPSDGTPAGPEESSEPRMQERENGLSVSHLGY
jgi:hypothetical protein